MSKYMYPFPLDWEPTPISPIMPEVERRFWTLENTAMAVCPQCRAVVCAEDREAHHAWHVGAQ